MEPMELNICEGDYGLSSLDSDCLHLMLLAKVTKLPLNVTSRQVKYPVFVHDTNALRNYSEVQNYLLKLGYSPDISLNSQETYEAYVVINMLKFYLSPVIKYLWWVNEYNYENFTSKWFKRSFKFPYNLHGLRQLRNEASSLLQIRFPDEDLENVKQILLKQFKECFPSVSTRLANSLYYYGNNISSVDIILYGYLAPILSIPFPDNEFKDVLEKDPVFSKFVSRINQIYFPDIQYTEKYIKGTLLNEDADLNHQNIVFFFGFMVSLVMIGLSVLKVSSESNVKS